MSDTTRGKPLRRDAAANRDRILKAAGEVFAERGLDASLNDIAERAGVGMGTIYRRFPDKSSLVEALLEVKVASMYTVIDEAAARPSGWEAFVTLLTGLLTLFSADRALEEILLSDYGDHHTHRTLRMLRDPATEIIGRAQDEGQLRADLTFTDLPILLSMLGGAAQTLLPIGGERWHRYLYLLLDGLRAEPAREPLVEAALSVEELELITGEQRVRRWRVPPSP